MSFMSRTCHLRCPTNKEKGDSREGVSLFVWSSCVAGDQGELGRPVPRSTHPYKAVPHPVRGGACSARYALSTSSSFLDGLAPRAATTASLWKIASTRRL